MQRQAAMGPRWIPDVHTKSESVGGGVFALLKIKPLRNTLIASGIVSAAWDVYQFFMPIYGRAQGLSATAIGTVMSAFAVSIILVRVLMPFALRRAGPAQLLTYAMFVACAAYLLFPLAHTAWTLAAISFVLGDARTNMGTSRSLLLMIESIRGAKRNVMACSLTFASA